MTNRPKLSERLRVRTPDYDDMVSAAEELEARAARADQGAERRAQLQVSERGMYDLGSGHSFFADLARAQRRHGDGDGGWQAAVKRLQDHNMYEHRRNDRLMQRLNAERELERELTRDPHAAAVYERWVSAGGRLFDKIDESRDVERRAAGRTDGSGGYFAPPGWFIDQFAHSARAGAEFAALWTQLPLPKGVQSVNIPILAAGQGAGTAVQTADGAAVTIRDPADSSVKAPIQTIAANLDMSFQFLDQTPAPIDDTVGADILEDFSSQLDGHLLLGSGSDGQLNGAIPGGTFSAASSIWLSDTNNSSSQTWVNGGTDITSSVHQFTAMLYAKIARYRGLPPTAFVMSPLVWALICGSADGQNRPLVEPGRAQKMLHGLPVVEDANLVDSFGGATAPSITTSYGVTSVTPGDGSYAPILAGRFSDLFYFAADPIVEVMPEVLSGALQVRYQVRRYVASMPGRVVWGGDDITFSGTDQGGGVNQGAAVSYGALTSFETNSPLALSSAGY